MNMIMRRLSHFGVKKTRNTNILSKNTSVLVICCSTSGSNV